MKRSLKDCFIPHEGNDYSPHSLQKAAMVGMFALVLLSFAFINIQSLLWVSSDWLVSTVLPAVIVDLTNQERASDSLSYLKRNPTLDLAATRKAEDMAEHEYFAHFSPTGVSPWYWFNDVQYNFVHAGENLAIHFNDSDAVVKAWMDSPTHRANIMDGKYTEIGVGTAKGVYDGYPTVYVVQMFGTPGINLTDKVTKKIITARTDDSLASLGESNNGGEVSLTNNLQSEVLSESVNTTAVENIDVSGNQVVVYSNHISTSTGGVPASISADNQPRETVREANVLSKLATSPRSILQILYLVIALFVVGSLLLSILIDIKYQNPIQVAYSFVLLIMMAGLYQIHILVTAGATII